MQQNVTTGLGGDLCGLLAKQTDEGNLSCGVCSAEQGSAAPTIVSVVSHLSRNGGREEGEREREKRQGEGETGKDGDV